MGRPTLYADEFVEDLRELDAYTPDYFREKWDHSGTIERLSALARILPRRCVCPADADEDYCLSEGDCEGRGWSYPDMPEWFMDVPDFADTENAVPWERVRESQWFDHCYSFWRAMGIWEATDA